MKICHAGGLVLLLMSVSACAPSAYMSPKQFEHYLNDPDVPRVAFEVCMPSNKVYFEDFYVDYHDRPIRFLKWREPVSDAEIPENFIKATTVTNTGGVRSTGASILYLVGSTAKEQPVFLQRAIERPGDLLGIGIPISTGSGVTRVTTTYWYRVPKRPTAQSALWQSPFAKEQSDKNSRSGSVDLKLMNGMEVPDQAISESAPRLRFSLKTYSEQWRPADDVQNAKEAALKRFQTENPRLNLMFLTEPLTKEIPAC